MSITAPHDSGSDDVAKGVTIFAGILLATVSFLSFLQGVAALATDTIYVDGLEYNYALDLTAWGWVHLVLGVIGVLTGVGILVDMTWAWIVGVVVAVLSTIANFMFLPYYPFWSMVVIALDIFVIWALCTRISHRRG